MYCALDPEQAKLKALPYRDAAEMIAEKFRCDRKFLEQLNPGKTKNIKAGEQLQVPNVEHGTNEPDTIGHSSSHGCIRLGVFEGDICGRAFRFTLTANHKILLFYFVEAP